MSSQRSIIHSPTITHSDIPGLNSSMSAMMHHTESMQPAVLATSVSQMMNHTEQHVQPSFISRAVESSRALDTMSVSQNPQQLSISPVQPPIRPASAHAIRSGALDPNGFPNALDINRAQSVRLQMPPMPPASNQQTRSPINVFHKMFWKSPDKLSPQMPLNRSLSSRSLQSPGGLRNGQSNLPSPPLPTPPLPTPRAVGGGLPRFDSNAVPATTGGVGFLAPRTP